MNLPRAFSEGSGKPFISVPGERGGLTACDYYCMSSNGDCEVSLITPISQVDKLRHRQVENLHLARTVSL